MDDGAVPVIALVGFIGLVLIVLGLVHYYIWWRAIRSTTARGSRGRRIGTWLIVAAFLCTVGAQIGTYLLPSAVGTPLAWIGFSWLGFAFYMLLFLLVGELIRLGVRIFAGHARRPAAAESTPAPLPIGIASGASAGPGTVRADEQPDRTNEHDHTSGPDRTSRPDGTSGSAGDGESREVNRRLFLSRSIALGAGVAAAGVGGYGIARALADPIVRVIPIRIPGLDPRLGGFRITMFADAHLGSIRRKPVMERLVDLVNGTEPDLVAVVGDLIDGSVAELRGDVAPLAGLVAPQGTYFVTGNHEYYSGAREWVEFLPDLGIRVLANERVAIEREGAVFDLAGVNDPTGDDYENQGGGPDFAEALDGRRSDRPVVLLAHQPVTVDRSVEYGVDLQLSGHTHGGQLWPFDYVVDAEQGAVSGLYAIEDTQLYVTDGVGFWGPPMRVGADPELIVIELQPGDSTG